MEASFIATYSIEKFDLVTVIKALARFSRCSNRGVKDRFEDFFDAWSDPDTFPSSGGASSLEEVFGGYFEIELSLQVPYSDELGERLADLHGVAMDEFRDRIEIDEQGRVHIGVVFLLIQRYADGVMVSISPVFKSFARLAVYSTSVADALREFCASTNALEGQWEDDEHDDAVLMKIWPK